MGMRAHDTGDQEVPDDLNRLSEQHPSLMALVELHREIEAILAATNLSAKIGWAVSPLGREALDQGRPLLVFDDLGLDASAFAVSALRMYRCLEHHGVAGSRTPDEGEAPGTGDDTGEVDPDLANELLSLACAGFEQQSGPTDAPFAGSLMGLAVGQVLAGALKSHAGALQPALDADLWHRGCCPICGGWPDLGVISPQDEMRRLACGRCDSLWPYRRVGCPFCGRDDQVRRFSSPDGRFSLSWCTGCRTYLKHARWPAEDLPRSITGLRLLTVGLDLDAGAHGWDRRPAAVEALPAA